MVKMSMPMYQQPPPVTVAEQYSSYDSASEHDSLGPLVGVLIVVIVLGIIAVMIGRLCSGRRFMGYGQYDRENWAENKCSTCIDGRINLSPPLTRATEPTTTSLPATPIHTTNQQTEQSSQNQTST